MTPLTVIPIQLHSLIALCVSIFSLGFVIGVVVA